MADPKQATPAEVLRAHAEAILEMVRGGLFHADDSTVIEASALELRLDAIEIAEEGCYSCGVAKKTCDADRSFGDCCLDCDHDHSAQVTR